MICDRTRYRLRCVQGGYRSGKSWGGAAGLIEQALASGGLPQLVCGPTHRVLEDVCVATIMELCDAAKLPCVRRKSDKQLVIGRRQKTLVYLRSAEQSVGAMQAITVAGAWGDEWEFWPLEVLKAFLARVSIGSRSVILTSTAEGYNDRWSLLLKNPAPSTKLYVWQTRLNQEIAADYIADMRDRLADEQEAAEKLDGVRTAKSGRVYSRYAREVHTVRECVERGRGEIVAAADFNAGRNPWIVARWNDATRSMHVVGEIARGSQDTAQAAEALVSLLARVLSDETGEPWSRDDVRAKSVRVFCDASGKNKSGPIAGLTHVSVLAQAGLRPIYGATNPPVEDRVETVQGMLRDVRLTVDPRRAPWLVECLEQQPKLPSGAPDKSTGHDDALDALGYACFLLAPVWRPKASVAPGDRRW